jgi:hypothetical protein
MKTGSQLTWNELLAETCEIFKVLARNRLRASGLIPTDEWYDIAAEAAERATPRRDIRLLEVLHSCPALMTRPLAEGGGSLGETVFLTIREGLQDELAGRLNSLQEEVVRGRGVPPAARSVQALKESAHAHRSWDLFMPRLGEAFALRLESDEASGSLPNPDTEPEAAARYIESFMQEVVPEDLDDILALMASSPTLALRPPAATQTFEGCASQTFEEFIAEWLTDTFKERWERGRML